MLPKIYFTFQSLYEANAGMKQTVQSKDLAKLVFDKRGLGHARLENFETLMSSNTISSDPRR